MERYEAHEIANLFPMMDEVDFENLKNDISEGFDAERPILLYENKILDGRNRYKACVECNIEPVFKNYEGDNPVKYVISTNLNRRHLNASQRACIAVKALPLFQAEAKKRQQIHGNTAPGRKTVVELMPQVNSKEEGKSRDQAGSQFNVSGRYVAEAQRLQEESPEKFNEVLSGEKTITEVIKEEKIEQRKQKIEEQKEQIEKENLAQPEGLFDVIVIDPPWAYGREYDPDSSRVANPYPEMSQEDLLKIELPAKDNCILWLWTTNLFMKDAYELLSKWGFEHKTILTWDKVNMGVGYWLRSRTEHCILAIKGTPVWTNTTHTTILTEKRTEHSTKPEGFYKMVDEICVGRKLDYFARKKRDGWEVFGDEVN